MSIGRIVLLTAAGFVLLLVFVPGIRNGVTQTLTSLSNKSETITVPAVAKTNPSSQASSPLPSKDGDEPASVGEDLDLNLVTLLGYDAIPAILDPEFIDVAEAERQLEPDELVLGLEINGEAKAYSIPMLSSHEIVNDVVGGVPLAVTW